MAKTMCPIRGKVCYMSHPGNNEEDEKFWVSCAFEDANFECLVKRALEAIVNLDASGINTYERNS